LMDSPSDKVLMTQPLMLHIGPLGLASHNAVPPASPTPLVRCATNLPGGIRITQAA
jgi:hypothetical protein